MEDFENMEWNDDEEIVLPDEESHLDVNSDFWTLFKDLVALVYMTEPTERLGIVVPIMEEEYGTTNTRTYERVENTVLRIVAWIETWAS